MKKTIKKIIPDRLKKIYREIRYDIEDRRNRGRTPAQVFSEIYRKGIWGTTGAGFFSGTGSMDESVTRPYVEMVKKFLLDTHGGKARVVDLGCGDFVVGRQLIDACGSYVGVDVVPELIEFLQTSIDDERVRFVCMDIVDDPLPDGDVCFVRQVLQHLSNEQIATVLGKLTKYRAIFVTEHYPSDESQLVKNRDKVHGDRIRLLQNSAVYLDAKPFNVIHGSMRPMLEVHAHDPGDGNDPGVIRTYLLLPNTDLI